MIFSGLFSALAGFAVASAGVLPRNNGSPSITTINSTNWELSNGGNFKMTLNSRGYAYSIVWNGQELSRNTTGGYSDANAGRISFNFTNGPAIVKQTSDQLHVSFKGALVTVHYILFSGLSGHYQWVTVDNLPPQGEVRSLYRLDPELFTRGRTDCRDDILPPISEIQNGFKVQDETWQRRDGSYITKYDFSCYQRDNKFFGIYGDKVGAWVIAPGQDYVRGDHLAQELMVHRESSTNHAVLLHYLHGTHYTTTFANTLNGKMLGPWLLYVNDGNVADASARASQEHSSWPYTWTGDSAYDNRAAVNGRLVLSDGRPASGAAVFLGDEDGSETGNQGDRYQYTTYARDDGSFTFDGVRKEKGYRLIAWANGGSIGDVFKIHNGTTVSFSNSSGANLDLGQITWQLPSTARGLWQIGTFDKKTTGFKLAGGGYQHGRSDWAPRDLNFAIGTNKDEDWYFAQTGQGNWTVIFDPVANSSIPSGGNATATLWLSFAGWSSGGFADPADLGLVKSLNVSLNTNLIGVGYSSNDKALYRSATVSGGWQHAEFVIPASSFLSDKPNRLDLTLLPNERWRGIMWDALKLQWN